MRLLETRSAATYKRTRLSRIWRSGNRRRAPRQCWSDELHNDVEACGELLLLIVAEVSVDWPPSPSSLSPHMRFVRMTPEMTRPAASPLDEQGAALRASPWRFCIGQGRPCGSAVALPQQCRSSELEAGAGVHHRCLPAVHRADDLLRGDPSR